MTAPRHPDGFTFVDLFAGAGGFALGLHAAGASPTSVAVEHDPDCAATLRHNFPDATVIEQDMREVSFARTRADVVVGGPPCQGFSALNRNRAGDQRNGLTFEVVRCADAVRPRIIVVENVPAFLRSPEFVAFSQALAERGFQTRAGVVNAADYGVPQRRKRALVVATTAGTAVPWPRETHGARRGLPPHRTVADAFALLPTEPTGENWHVDTYTDRSAHLERVKAVPEGGSRKDLPADLVLDCWRGVRGYADVLGRLEWHRPATTVRTEFFRPEKGRFLHPSEDRPISPREAARIQSFPDSFVFPPDQGLYAVGRQIGNAIPPRLAEAIGQSIAASLRRKPLRRRDRTRSAA